MYVTKEDLMKFRQQLFQQDAHNAERAEMLKQIRTITSKIGDFDEFHEYLKFKLNHLENEAKTKAEHSRFAKLEIDLETNYAKQKEVSRIINRLESYTSLESFNTMRIDFEKTLAQINSKFTKIPLNVDLSSAIKKTKEFTL